MNETKKRERWLIIILALNVLIFLLTIGDFLALHDIRNDYVSPEILDRLGMTTSTLLPEWTATQLEWGMVMISFVGRFVFSIINALLLWWLFKRKPEVAD